MVVVFSLNTRTNFITVLQQRNLRTWYMTFNNLILVCRHYHISPTFPKFVFIMISNKEMLYYEIFGTVKLCSRVRGI